MRRMLLGSLAAIVLASGASAAPLSAPAPLASLVAQVDIPYQQFTLANGLRVLVHTDRKAPVVAVSVWYHIGSRDEPANKTGFAHLFEHLMFYGSENSPGSALGKLEGIGATDLNGTTYFDRTNYFETVPTGALDRALFIESDRMGHLLGAVTQTTLDLQRGVVENEKRMDDNEPAGLVNYTELATLLPPGHPYRHTTIGSMEDVGSASLDDVKAWFRGHYGPNNAVLVLAGDIDLATAQAKVGKWFGPLTPGPATIHPAATVPPLAADVDKVMRDQVATVSISREWTAPGLNDPAVTQLDLAMSVLGGLGSSRIDTALVRNEKLAIAVSAEIQPLEGISFIEVNAKVRPGVDPALVAKRLDALIADFIRTGPSADEVSRGATEEVADRIKGLEQVGGLGGKAAALASGAVYSNDPDRYKKDLAEIAAATPASIAAATRTWLGRPVFRLTVAPGKRSGEDIAIAGSAEPAAGPGAAKPIVASTPPPAPTIAAPPILPVADLAFPALERARLSNGMPVVFARRAGLPTLRIALSFDAGNAADDRAKLGTQALMLALMDEGTTHRDALALAEEEERLGADIGIDASVDTTTIELFALKPNLGASLDLLADIVRNPAFAPAEIERIRASQLAKIATENTEPQSIAFRVLPPLLYGAGHPYGIPFTGTGDEAGVKAATRADLVAFQHRWIRPDNATIFVVGDASLAELLPQLDARFGDWTAPAEPKGVKHFGASPPAPAPRIILIDRPQSPQSLIVAGLITPIRGTDDTVPLNAANEVVGGSASSRLTLDLRETRSWAYYAGSALLVAKENFPFLVFAPVQADKTGAAIAAARQDIVDFVSKKGTTPGELRQTIDNLSMSLPGSFETSGDLIAAMMRIIRFDRPDDYYSKLPSRYRALTAAQLDAAARAALDPARLVWVVIGDAKLVRPQLEGLGLRVETGQGGTARPGG